MTRSFACLVAIAIACGPYEDVTPLIHVNPNAAKRLEWIHGGIVDAGAPAPSAARVHVMKSGEELGGPNATGRAGDLLLENDEVAFVIDQLGKNSSAGFAESGGNIIDAADARVRKDELGQVFSYFGAFPRQGVYESLLTGVLADGTAFIEARGKELYEPSLVLHTRYTLHGNDRALLIETTVDNTSDHMIAVPGLGDAIQWGGAEKFSPERGRGFKGKSSASFLAGIGRFVSYAITSTDGAIDAVSGSSWSDTSQQGRTEIPAGKSVHYARVFLVGPRADVSGLVTELTKAAGGAVGAVRVELVDTTGKVTATPDATIEIANESGKPFMDLRADSNGVIAGDLPPGRMQLRYSNGGGRGARGNPQTIVVIANQESAVTLEVTAPGRMHAECKERVVRSADATPVPCKATFEAIVGKNPDFGPAMVAGPARNQVTTSDGVIDVALAPNKYRVILSRGPEYALSTFEVDVQPGASAQACDVAERCLLKRVVDTNGWLSCDFHQHTMLGVDAPTGTRDRVIGNVAEGVEVAVASEHNVVADLEPLVRDMGLADRLVQIAGNELTSDSSRKPWGHANVFPLAVHPDLPRGGAIVLRDRTAKDLFAEVRTQSPNAVLQINHPRSGTTGYFDLYKFDRALGVGSDPAYDARFDAIELWNGRNVAGRNDVLTDVLALLKTSHPVTITGNTDTHGMVGQEAGYPRTYVKVSSDRDLATWSDARTADLVHAIRETREVLITNGPFVRVRAGAATIGGIATARGGKLAVQVTVETAPWIEVKHVKIIRVLGPQTARTEKLEADVTARANAAGAMVATAQFDLAVDRDDAFMVEVSGDKSLSPVVAGDAAELHPYALTGAIWIDADADGHALGR